MVDDVVIMCKFFPLTQGTRNCVVARYAKAMGDVQELFLERASWRSCVLGKNVRNRGILSTLLDEEIGRSCRNSHLRCSTPAHLAHLVYEVVMPLG